MKSPPPLGYPDATWNAIRQKRIAANLEWIRGSILYAESVRFRANSLAWGYFLDKKESSASGNNKFTTNFFCGNVVGVLVQRQGSSSADNHWRGIHPEIGLNFSK
jgi:hypothetical protein